MSEAANLRREGRGRPERRRIGPRFRIAALGVAATAAMGLVALPGTLGAHEIPPSVRVTMIVKPEGRVLRAVVRVPLEAMRDVDFPARADGFLDLPKAATLLGGTAKLWIADYLKFYEGGAELTGVAVTATRLAMPYDRAFASYDEAVAHFAAPGLAPELSIPWKQAMLDVMLEVPVADAASRFSVHPALAHLGIRTSTVLRFIPPGGSERAYAYDGDPGIVHLDPQWYQAALNFVARGFGHILDGIDHLLFLLCLVIPFRKPKPLVGVVTAFTVAHSITLIAAAVGFAPDALWFPPLIEFLIALSIVAMAIENVLGANQRRRWVVAFLFGLVHGFGFSFALRENLQFAGAHFYTALVGFNVGVELGQLAVLAVLLPALVWVFAKWPRERALVIVMSALVAHQAWHWLTDRYALLRKFSFEWPALDMAFAAGAMRLLMLLLVAGLALWVLSHLARRYLAAVALVTAAIGVAGSVAAQSAGALPPRRATSAATSSTRSAVYSDAQALRGQELYLGFCKQCHTAESHTGTVFRSWWSGRRLGDLFSFVSTRMPKNEPGSLDPQHYADLVAYLLKMNEMPSGPTELPPDAAALQKIKIVTPPATARKRKQS